MKCECGEPYQLVCFNCELKNILVVFCLEIFNTDKFPKNRSFENVLEFIEEFIRNWPEQANHRKPEGWFPIEYVSKAKLREQFPDKAS